MSGFLTALATPAGMGAISSVARGLGSAFGGGDRLHKTDTRDSHRIANEEARKQAIWNIRYLMPRQAVEEAKAFREQAKIMKLNPLTLLGGAGAQQRSTVLGQGAANVGPITTHDGGVAGNVFNRIADYASGETERMLEEEKAKNVLHQVEDDLAIRGKSGKAIAETKEEMEKETDAAGQELMGDLAVGGHIVEPDKNWSDAEVIEGRYGDVASWVYGLGVVTADARKALLDRTGTDNIDDAVIEVLKRSRGWRRDLKEEIEGIHRKGRLVNGGNTVDNTDYQRAKRTNTGGY